MMLDRALRATPPKRPGNADMAALDHMAALSQARLAKINRSNMVKEIVDIPINMCCLPPEHLRTRVKLVDLEHVEVMKRSYLRDYNMVSPWIVVVFGIDPTKFRLDNIKHLDKVTISFMFST